MFRKKLKTFFVGIFIFGILLPVLFYFMKPNITSNHLFLFTSHKIDPFVPTFNHSQWIVVTSVLGPTEQIGKLAALSNWKVVVVGDRKTPTNWSYPGCVYLSVDDQLNLGYQITKHLPYNSYTRKMIGYLYAIQNGARFIYDTDDDNCPSNGQLEFILEPSSSGLIYADLSQAVMNPYPHFGQPQLWPRGFPLERIAQAHNHTYHLCTLDTAAVQQGLVNGDPDVDAIYRLINKGSNADININVTFDIRAPPFTLPRGVFAPFNSQNTLFSYPALWALFLPVTVDFRVTDIWRGYWAQRLLWLTGNHLAFHPPNAVQARNPHSYLKDFKEEIQMYKESNQLVDFLSQWQCDSTHFFQCVEMLTAEMVKQQFIKELDLNIIQLWLSDLIRMGYEEPKIVSKSLESMCLSPSNWVNYCPRQTPPPNSGYNDLLSMCREFFPHNYLRKKEIEKHTNSTRPPQTSFSFENILLVIIFNFPHLQNVRLLEVLYRDHFPNLLFCSESKSRKELMEMINNSTLKSRENDFSFINATDLNWGWFGYECAIRAMEMNYKVDGYMFLGDDVLLRPWKLLPFDPTISRMQNDSSQQFYLNRTDSFPLPLIIQYWWYHPAGYLATNAGFAEVESIANNVSDPQSLLFRTFIENRVAKKVDMSLVSIGLSDFYYVSKRESFMFLPILKVFLKNKVHTEVAVPNAFIGCSAVDDNNHEYLGKFLMHIERFFIFNYLNNETVYIHPIKLSSLMDYKKMLGKYCLGFVSEYLNSW